MNWLLVISGGSAISAFAMMAMASLLKGPRA